MKFTRAMLIEELELCVEQLRDLGNEDKEVKVFHSVCTGGYGGDMIEIDSFELNFTAEDDGEVVLMNYEVNELRGI